MEAPKANTHHVNATVVFGKDAPWQAAQLMEKLADVRFVPIADIRVS